MLGIASIHRCSTPRNGTMPPSNTISILLHSAFTNQTPTRIRRTASHRLGWDMSIVAGATTLGSLIKAPGVRRVGRKLRQGTARRARAIDDPEDVRRVTSVAERDAELVKHEAPAVHQLFQHLGHRLAGAVAGP